MYINLKHDDQEDNNINYDEIYLNGIELILLDGFGLGNGKSLSIQQLKLKKLCITYLKSQIKNSTFFN